MKDRLRSLIKKHKLLFFAVMLLRHPWLSVISWLYGSYLTYRYVDEYQSFPAIKFTGSVIRLKIHKANDSSLILKGKLLITPFIGGVAPSILSLAKDSVCTVNGDFIIGDDVRIQLSEGAYLKLEGKQKSSGSGVTCQSKILVAKSVTIGADSIISWGTFITDSDHHLINEKLSSIETRIGKHVWLAAGCQILKGSVIGKNSIVAAHSVITKGIYPDQSLLVGSPAYVKGKAPLWCRE
ncbi:MAG: acyltransferase [Methylococcaceae bacterium]